MPELPEVQVTLNYLQPRVVGQKIESVILRTQKLRWPLDASCCQKLAGATVLGLERRAKYLLLSTDKGWVIIHLGMAGSLKLVPLNMPITKHDYVDVVFSDFVLRFSDPRKFGTWLFTDKNPLEHKLLADLGIEPLHDEFDGQWLWQKTRKSALPIKQFLMKQQNVVGVGNIYASESLFAAKIHPKTASQDLSLAQCKSLVQEIKKVLHDAIVLGGTSLRDFVKPDGNDGKNGDALKVYGRCGKPCYRCKTLIESFFMAQRNTFVCSQCQK